MKQVLSQRDIEAIEDYRKRLIYIESIGADKSFTYEEHNKDKKVCYDSETRTLEYTRKKGLPKSFKIKYNKKYDISKHFFYFGEESYDNDIVETLEEFDIDFFKNGIKALLDNKVDMVVTLIVDKQEIMVDVMKETINNFKCNNFIGVINSITTYIERGTEFKHISSKLKIDNTIIKHMATISPNILELLSIKAIIYRKRDTSYTFKFPISFKIDGEYLIIKFEGKTIRMHYEEAEEIFLTKHYYNDNDLRQLKTEYRFREFFDVTKIFNVEKMVKLKVNKNLVLDKLDTD